MIYYKSRRTNETYVFDDLPQFLNSSDLRGWEWDVSTLNGSSRYHRVPRDPKAILTFTDKDEAQRFFALADADTQAGVEAILSIDDFYMRGNISAGSIESLSKSRNQAAYEVTFHSDLPLWRREIGKYEFKPSSGSSSGLDFPFDFPFDFGPPPSGQRTINVDALGPCDFQLIFYGPVENPAVTINGVKREVLTSVPTGSLLFVNSLNNKRGDTGTSIFLRSSDGTVTNEYNQQSREADIFYQVQPGQNLITWSGLFGFDLILYETRGIRPW